MLAFKLFENVAFLWTFSCSVHIQCLCVCRDSWTLCWPSRWSSCVMLPYRRDWNRWTGGFQQRHWNTSLPLLRTATAVSHISLVHFSLFAYYYFVTVAIVRISGLSIRTFLCLNAGERPLNLRLTDVPLGRQLANELKRHHKQNVEERHHNQQNSEERMTAATG